MKTSELNHLSNYNTWIHNRLSDYCNQSGESKSEIESYFRSEARKNHIDSLKQLHYYFAELDAFLQEVGY